LQAAPFPKDEDNVADDQRDVLDDACWHASEDLIGRARSGEFMNRSCTAKEQGSGGGWFAFDPTTLSTKIVGALLVGVLLVTRRLKRHRKVPSDSHDGGGKAVFVRMGVAAFLIVQLLTEIMNGWVATALALSCFVLWVLLVDGCLVLFPAHRPSTAVKPKVFVIGLSRTGHPRAPAPSTSDMQTPQRAHAAIRQLDLRC
jgi:hypothetical protein